jgi:hypothetical protein
MIHLVKLCVGCDTIEDLATWQKRRLEAMRAARQKPELFHRTFQTPKRRQELLSGGSLYWVIKGLIQARQRVTDLREGSKDDGTPCCLIMLDQQLVPVDPVPRRAFQGWRYLEVDDAPADIAGDRARGLAALPPGMRKELAELGLL